MNLLTARVSETQQLDAIWKSPRAEFLVLYGRRRVGKTFLIREYFKNQGVYFELTGLHKGNMTRQLENFFEKFLTQFESDIPVREPKNWRDAFLLLNALIERSPKNKKIVIFLDELPWLATKKSGLLQEIDYFWNGYWVSKQNVILILCGSAASWMLDNVIHDKGGLHNRITRRILLRPFNLRDTKEYIDANKLNKSSKQILDMYMVLGGIPLYLQQIKRGLSAPQNIEQICFNENGLLFDEFEKLYRSLFLHHEEYIEIVKAIALRHYGISIGDLLATLKKTSGGRFIKQLRDLEAAGFIQKFIPFGKKSRDRYYRTSDEFTSFYYYWQEEYLSLDIRSRTKNYWTSRVNTPRWNTWCGYAFENVCFKHIPNIQAALGIEATPITVSSWQYQPKYPDKTPGCQIDCLFDRDDGVITIIEFKYSTHMITIDKEYAQKLKEKILVFEKQTGTKKKVSLVLVTTVGLNKNSWSEDLIDQVVTIDDLFK